MNCIRRRRTSTALLACLLALMLGFSLSVLANDTDGEPELFSAWPDDVELPQSGQARLEINGQSIVFDQLTACGLTERGRAFLMTANREDGEGRYQSFRMYRRLIGHGTASPGEEDLVQLGVRDHDRKWSNSVMRLQLRDSNDDAVYRVYGHSDDWPAVQVRPGGTAAVAQGELSRPTDSGDLAPIGAFIAVANCSIKND